MAGFTVAMGIGWVVSPVISLIISKTQTYISNNYFKKADIEGEMKKMDRTLNEILAIMREVEKQKVVDTHQVRLVHQIKEAVYDAEDVIDEFEYYILKGESEKFQKKKVSQMASSSTTTRAIPFLRGRLCLRPTRDIHSFVVGDPKFKKKVKKVGDSLDGAKVSANMLKGLMKITISQNIATQTNENPYVTSSRLTEPDLIVGREDECRRLKRKLQKDNVSRLPTIIPIIGQGGIGKTTLVQMILNDKEVLNQEKNDKKVKPIFDEVVWVTVSDNFNKVRLTKEILKHLSVKSKTEGAVGFNKLQEELEKQLASKNVLMVLDDVWYDGKQYINKKDWLEVLDPFKNAEKKSKIILTTRLPDVKSIFGASTTTIDPIKLDGLSKEDSLSLFDICAFDGMKNQKQQVLKPIGKKIVDKLRGSPLAIRVLGHQLNRNPDVEHWTIVSNNPLDTRDIMNILHRSYDHLPDHLKRCFAYCSIFPKDYRFKRDRLVHMWIAHGFVHSENKNELVDVGIGYFNDLVDRLFFKVIKQWWEHKIYYVMHDLMNDLACDVSKGECLIHDKGEAIKDLGSIRHLSLDPISLSLSNVPCLCKLRTLIVLDPYSSETEEKIDPYSSETKEKHLWAKFHMLRKIRVLDVQFISEQNLTDICESKHLRYLSFRITKRTILPDCFRNLCHLSALFLRKGYKNVSDIVFHVAKGSFTGFHVVTLPESTCSMSSLILVKSSKFLCPNVVGTQSSMGQSEYTSSFHVTQNSRHLLGLLGKMNRVSSDLSISGLENVTSWKETEKAQIHKKKHLRRLTLEWDHVLEMDPGECHEVLESLRPNSTLEKLNITGYPGTAWPSWFESNLLPEIFTIDLINCKEVKTLPVFGKLRNIRFLKLVGLAAMTKLDLKCYDNGALPFLAELQIRDMERLEEILNCPGVRRLVIWSCPKFKGLGLDGFASTKHIKISWLDVSLERLLIVDCPDLVSLPEMEIFASLRFLEIFNCPALNSLSKKDLPVSLKVLALGGRTHQCLEEQIRNKKGPDWDKITAISGCDLYASFESGEHIGLMSTLDDISRSIFGITEDIAKKLQPFKVNKGTDAEHSTERGSTIPNITELYRLFVSQRPVDEASSSNSVSPWFEPPASLVASLQDGQFFKVLDVIHTSSKSSWIAEEFSGFEADDEENSGSEPDGEENSGSEVDGEENSSTEVDEEEFSGYEVDERDHAYGLLPQKRKRRVDERDPNLEQHMGPTLQGMLQEEVHETPQPTDATVRVVGPPSEDIVREEEQPQLPPVELVDATAHEEDSPQPTDVQRYKVNKDVDVQQSTSSLPETQRTTMPLLDPVAADVTGTSLTFHPGIANLTLHSGVEMSSSQAGPRDRPRCRTTRRTCSRPSRPTSSEYDASSFVSLPLALPAGPNMLDSTSVTTQAQNNLQLGFQKLNIWDHVEKNESASLTNAHPVRDHVHVSSATISGNNSGQPTNRRPGKEPLQDHEPAKPNNSSQPKLLEAAIRAARPENR